MSAGGSESRPLWQEAVSFACRQHEHQTRRDGRTPYVAHAVRVMMTVRDLFGCADGEALAAAVLHDTIEDTTADFDDIEGSFGATVAEIVAALSKNMLLREDERERDYDARLASADWRARLIKLGDVYDNLCDAVTRADHDPDAPGRLLSRCHRALALAQPDAPAHAETARAIGIVRAVTEGV